MTLTPDFLVAILAVFVAGVLRGFSGFGVGMVLVPILSLLYSPMVAVITVVLLEIIPSIQLVPGSIAHCDWRSVMPMAISGIITVPIGSFLLVSTDANTMRICIALLVILCVVILATGWRFEGGRTLKAPTLTGMASGLISGAASLGGLPVILFYLSGGHSSQVARASIVVFLFITTMISLLTYSLHGIISADILLRTIMLVPIFILAIWVGGKLFGKVSESLFRAVTLTLLGGVGVVMLIS